MADLVDDHPEPAVEGNAASSPVVLFVLDPVTERAIFYGPNLAEQFGWTEGSGGDWWLDAVVPEDREQADAIRSAWLRAGAQGVLHRTFRERPTTSGPSATPTARSSSSWAP
jgi:PAS domain-containing protein